jgi:hypothetical protein
MQKSILAVNMPPQLITVTYMDLHDKDVLQTEFVGYFVK